MESRSKINIPLTLTDKLLEATGWFILFVIWLFVFINYASLPEIIPIHFNVEGVADGYGKKETLFFLPMLSTIFYVGLTLLNKFPHIFNYPANITKENAERHYMNATQMIRYIKLILTIVFFVLIVTIVFTAKGKLNGIGSWFIPLFIVLLFIPTGYFIFRSIRMK